MSTTASEEESNATNSEMEFQMTSHEDNRKCNVAKDTGDKDGSRSKSSSKKLKKKVKVSETRKRLRSKKEAPSSAQSPAKKKQKKQDPEQDIKLKLSFKIKPQKSHTFSVKKVNNMIFVDKRYFSL